MAALATPDDYRDEQLRTVRTVQIKPFAMQWLGLVLIYERLTFHLTLKG